MNETLRPGKRLADPDRLAAFNAAYAIALKKAVVKYPDQYTWPVENLPVVVASMTLAIKMGCYNHSGHGMRLACKALGIKHTRTAIEAFLKGE